MTHSAGPDIHTHQPREQRKSFPLQRETKSQHQHPEQRQEFNDLAQEFLVQFHTMLRILNLHARENEATQKVLLKLHEALQQLLAHQYELHIQLTDKDFLFNEHWVQLSPQLQEIALKLSQDLHHREIGGFRISALPRPQELLQFIKLLLAITPEETYKPCSQLQQQLWSHQIEWITLNKHIKEVQWDGQGVEQRSYVRQIYFYAIQVVQQLCLQAQQNKPLKCKTAKRAAQSFVDILSDPKRAPEADFLRMLTSIKNCVDYRYNRAVNTAIHSIGFAASLGFPRNTLRDIGVAGLLHDIGMIHIPAGLEHKSDPTSQEKRAIEAHPRNAVSLLLNTHLLDSSVMRAVNVAFAHHLGFQGGGYPHYGHSAQSPASKIVNIADQYDTLTTPHPARKKIMSPPQALGELTLLSDPILIRKFIDYMGPLPLGTLVRLNTQDIAYVIKQPPPGENPRHPIVKVLLSERGNHGRILDLSQAHADGKRPRAIVDILDLGQTKPQHALLQDLLT